MSLYHGDGKFDVIGNKIIKRSSGAEIPFDEPIFIFRARDKLALNVLKYYLDVSKSDGCTGYHLDTLEKQIKKFEEFAANNPERMKQPGITEGK